MSVSPTPSDRALARRQQVLDAAAECFRRRGFHAASMAEIAKTAGMSPGHIYNLFENKDDIIAAIVERDCAEVLGRIAEFQREEDLLQKMLAETERAIDERSQVADAALQLEVLAEASRNPRLAAVVRQTEALVSRKAQELIRQSLGKHADVLPPEEIEGRALLLGALFNGLTAMSVRQPDMPQKVAVMAPVMRRMLRVLLAP
ncbi:TetR/AcrR family transcriptional regulator [Roseateles saccharophilus]|uniref:TetR family transcriptional regulator n=1 Tax=Roseateles saccharophilus TaxID=304 RepID=A0A4R3U9D7_ROSSA|nr:TetR/AcrR family transcriptional regulator [Roseateles saccharophilus]MDG0835951.1 TetR/AcrR family transcriptional regulator [Roseateles saccharophilus]TCU82622.1 TetR family transcriptional regulator [Roseateles saccharophilus]